MKTELLKSQVGGQHYKELRYQPIEFIAKLHLSFSQGCIIKYISRYKYKNGLEDIKKAIHFCQLANGLHNNSMYIAFLMVIRPRFIQREINKYIELNNIETHAGTCIKYVVRGDFKSAEIALRILASTEYNCLEK